MPSGDRRMPDEVDGHLVATDMALKIMARLARTLREPVLGLA